MFIVGSQIWGVGLPKSSCSLSHEHSMTPDSMQGKDLAYPNRELRRIMGL